MIKRGHNTEVWSPKPILFKFGMIPFIKKWFGYVDQFILFPLLILYRARSLPKETLFVFSDHSLGPWMKLVQHKPNVMHCHDFLAQHIAQGKVPGQSIGLTGKWYQAYIRKGFTKGRNFISISDKTRNDLHDLVKHPLITSAMVYNGVAKRFNRKEIWQARKLLSQQIGKDVSDGYIVHVGGNQWYKNRAGVIRLYDALRDATKTSVPLILIGSKPTVELQALFVNSKYKDCIYFLTGMDDDFIPQAYSGATFLLFPSKAEGFGLPIVEAMASGCPVVTTAESPMTEAGGDAAIFIPRIDSTDLNYENCLKNAVETIGHFLEFSEEERDDVIKRGLKNAERFDSNTMLDQIEKIYKDVVADSTESERYSFIKSNSDPKVLSHENS